MWEELQSWWNTVPPETQANLQNGAFVLMALLGGHFVGSLVARALRNRDFDAVLRLPGSSVPAEPDRSFTPTFVAGVLVRLTIWAGAVWWLAQKYGRVELADWLSLVISRTWALAAILAVTLALGGLLAQRLMDCVQGFSKSGTEGSVLRNGAGNSHFSGAGIIGAAAYVLVVLVALLVTADMFNWPLTRSSGEALWKFAQNVMVAGTALFIGCLGARWARELGTSTGNTSPEQRASQYIGLAIMAATTVLALAVLLSGAGLLLALAAILVFALILWMLRGYLPDIVAGLQLRTHRVSEVWFDGVPWQVAQIGFVTTTLGRSGEFCRVQNRLVLDARMHGAPAELVAARARETQEQFGQR